MMKNNKNKSVLLICVNFAPEPVVSARLAHDISIELRDKGYLVTVLRPKPSRPLGYNYFNETSGIEGINEIVLNSYVYPESNIVGRIKESISFGLSCAKYIKEHNDEIGCVYADAWPIFSQKSIVKAVKKYSIPIVMHVQDIYPESYINKLSSKFRGIARFILLPIDKYILQNSSIVLVISDNMMNYLIRTRKLSMNKMAIVLNWQDEEQFFNFDKSLNIKEGNADIFTFMYLGNIGPVANVDLLIDSFAYASIPNSRLVIAGGGSMKARCIEQATKYKYVNIEFWDVPSGKVPEIQDQADVMLLSVKKDAALSSIPSKLPAYMFSSKPIIGSLDLKSDTAKAINNANCGWVLEPENKTKLSELMKIVSGTSKEILKLKGENGFEYAVNYLSKSHNLHLVTDIIEKTYNNVQ